MYPVKLKICGITQPEQATLIGSLPVDALGFICYPPSPRYVEPAKLRQLIAAVPPLVQTVGVFVNHPPTEIIRIFRETGLGLVQLHGSEGREVMDQLDQAGIPWIKALGVSSAQDLDAIEQFGLTSVLLDSYNPQEKGGTGKTFDWSLAQQAAQRTRVILAGGIGTENVLEAIAQVQPYGIDLSSSVESAKGIKDINKIKELLVRLGRLNETSYV